MQNDKLLVRKRLVFMISGNGTNLRAVIEAIANNKLNADIVVVITNNPNALGITIAKKANIETVILDPKKFSIREEYDRKLAALVSEFNPDLVVLAGWMRILSNTFLKQFPEKVINIHPALPGTFPGIRAIERAYEAYLSGKVSSTGVMVHYVPDDAIDAGPTILSEKVEINFNDTLDSLTAKMHAKEHKLIVEALKLLISA